MIRKEFTKSLDKAIKSAESAERPRQSQYESAEQVLSRAANRASERISAVFAERSRPRDNNSN